MQEKKHPDYSASAINLCNPAQVAVLVFTKKEKVNEIERLQTVLCAYPEYEQLQALGKEVTELDGKIRSTIDEYGSFQDLDYGAYGVKQSRKTVTFIANAIREIIPQYAEAVIDGVNKTKMNGLLKGGLITQEQADQCSEVKEDFAYIIK